MKLWVPEIPDPILVDTVDFPGTWSEMEREIYDMENYTAPNVTVAPGPHVYVIDYNINGGLVPPSAGEGQFITRAGTNASAPASPPVHTHAPKPEPSARQT